MRRTFIVAAVFLSVMSARATAESQGAVRVTGGLVELRAPHDVRSDGVGWLGSLEIRPGKNWPYFGMGFGNLPMKHASDKQGLLRIGATWIVSIIGGDQKPAALQLNLSGGVQRASFPFQDELPLAPGGSGSTEASTQISPYLGAGLGLEFGLGASTRLGLSGGASGALVDGSTYVYPTLGLALVLVVPSW